MDWKDFFSQEESKEYYQDLKKKIDIEYENNLCHPNKENIFKAFSYNKPEDVKVVILGQDPYHEINQANGLAFSVDCAKLPPSLKNIYKEMENDLNVSVNQDGDLSYLAKQGVLLLNTTMTVRNSKALSHKGLGWEIFSDNVIKYLDLINNPMVFILWGNNSRSKKNLITNKNHFIIESAHPSPLSAYRGFFNSHPFSRTNKILIENKLNPIKWYK